MVIFMINMMIKFLLLILNEDLIIRESNFPNSGSAFTELKGVSVSTSGLDGFDELFVIDNLSPKLFSSDIEIDSDSNTAEIKLTFSEIVVCDNDVLQDPNNFIKIKDSNENDTGKIVNSIVGSGTNHITLHFDNFAISEKEIYTLNIPAHSFKDLHGNSFVTENSKILEFSSDTTSPSIPIIETSIKTITNDRSPTIEGTAEPGSALTLFVDGVTTGVTTIADGTTGAYTIAPIAGLSDGNHTVTVTATDAAGNISPASSELNLTVDTTAPAQPTITTTTSLTNSATPTIEGIAEPGSTLTLFVDGETTGVTIADGTTGAYTIAPTAGLSDGNHTVTVTATRCSRKYLTASMN